LTAEMANPEDTWERQGIKAIFHFRTGEGL